jgi:hypothetical protein
MVVISLDVPASVMEPPEGAADPELAARPVKEADAPPTRYHVAVLFALATRI